MTVMPRSPRLLCLLVAAALGAVPAMAAPPPWAGGGKHEAGDDHKHERKAKKEHKEKKEKKEKHAVTPGAHFDDRNREAVRRYYASSGGKHCPPGLAKKNNGCMPPGQAKKQWAVGQPLPATVTVAPVPQQVLVSLPKVPAGHKYVQVAGDILLIAVGTQMVVDGINGLMSR
ncbi:MAG TPA: hypothetical protein VHL79_12445 [Ramlibacter sp.]|jgi:Ni/Co efflux regulator RcnB|nr:hypothetical protein [Ramlibacter sp.]